MSYVNINSKDYSLKVQLPNDIGEFDYRLSLYSELISILIEESLKFVKDIPAQEDLNDKYYAGMNDFWKFPEYHLEMLLTKDSKTPYSIEKLYGMIVSQIKKKHTEISD